MTNCGRFLGPERNTYDEVDAAGESSADRVMFLVEALKIGESSPV
ncbi:MAG: hypothetical protein ACFFD6_12100 [Candidatus Thorarchaeota archaeon]